MRRIQNDLDKMGLFLLERDGFKEFILPNFHHSNARFLVGIPVLNITSEGKFDKHSKSFGTPKYFYIPNKIYEQIHLLFEEFKIYKNLHEILLMAFISMFFIRCRASHADNNAKRGVASFKELQELIELIKNIADGTSEIEKFTIEMRDFMEGFDNSGNRNVGITYRKKFNGGPAAIQLEEILKRYKEELNNQLPANKTNLYYGSSSKNQLKFHQDYYADALYSYLNEYIYSETDSLESTSKEFDLLTKKLSRYYSTRKILLFIGKFMILSGLLNLKDNDNEEGIIDHLKKRLKKSLRKERLHKESFKD